MAKKKKKQKSIPEKDIKKATEKLKNLTGEMVKA